MRIQGASWQADSLGHFIILVQPANNESLFEILIIVFIPFLRGTFYRQENIQRYKVNIFR